MGKPAATIETPTSGAKMRGGFSDDFLKATFKIWGVLSLILIVANILAVHWNTGANFFTILNVVNLFLYAVSFLAKNNLNRRAGQAIEFFVKFNARVSHYQFDKESNASRKAGSILLVLLIVIGIYVCYVAVTNVDRYYWLIHEDNVVESASWISWALACVVFLSSIVRYVVKGHANAVTLILYSGLALFSFLCGGEEISWGQRMLNVNTPELLMQFNIQGETNLHNIGSISIFSNAFFLITLLFFLVAPYLYSKYFSDNEHLKYFLPIADQRTKQVFIVTLLVWIFVGLRFGTLGFHPYSFYEAHYYNQMDDEMFEFMAAYSFMCFSITDRLKRLKD